MNRYLAIINQRTFLVICVYLMATYLAIFFDMRFDYDITLISIAIIFPLVFTIRAAFRRREKSLEYLSRMKSGLMTIYYFFENSDKLVEDKKKEIRDILVNVPLSVNKYLMYSGDEEKVRAAVQRVFEFMQLQKESIPNGMAYKIFRFMKDVHQGIEAVMAVNRHRTPVSLRAYCLVFIYIFPFIYIPSFLELVGADTPQYILYLVVALKGFILISLFNVQEHMEDPFDQSGLDDIRLNDFELDVNKK